LSEIYQEKPRIYGLMGRFDQPEELLAAVERAYAAGYRVMDAYTPFPIEGLAARLGMRPSRMPLVIFLGGLLGAVGAFSLQVYASAIDYPLNVGGRPFFSWPAFIPITFEIAILLAAFAAVFGMFALNGLPMPYHPVFNAPSFELASRSHFFLAIERRDPLFDLEQTREFLQGLGAEEVTEVEQ
jgi:hypothetical protein